MVNLFTWKDTEKYELGLSYLQAMIVVNIPLENLKYNAN